MRRLLSTTALTGWLIFAAGAAQADPVTVALIANGVSIGAAVTAVYGVVGAFVIQLGASLLLTAGANALFGPSRPKAPALNRELQAPNSRPPKRYAYGRTRVYGSWVPVVAKDGILYGCMLLNSRPSEGNFKFFFDKREVSLTGDPYNFAGSGASATNSPFQDGVFPVSNRVRIWIGRGEQTTVPSRILSEASEFFIASDAWRGCTVAWMRLDRGPENGRAERWPRVPPEIEVEGDWSKVYDPRDPTQGADDPATWKFSNNQALCLLDALRQNPIRRYRMTSLMMPTFASAADVADEPTARKEAPTEPRYTANGLIIWNGQEIADQVRPLADAGGGSLVRMGGRLGYVAGAWRTPTYVMSDILEEGLIDYSRWRQGRELPTAIRVGYIQPDRDWQEAELTALPIVGADQITGSDDGVADVTLSMVTSPTQAMRIQQIMARKAAAQKRLSVTLPPDAFDLVAGATLQADMPNGFTRLNGLWAVDSADAGMWTADTEGGVAMRCPVKLSETDPSHYAWNPDTDQFDIVSEEFTPGVAPIAAPVDGSAVGGDGSITVQFTMPATGAFDEIEIWQSLTDDVSVAGRVFTANAGAAAVRSFVDTGLGAGATRFYFARAISGNRASTFSPSVTATTDP